jgi:hypothetical protein
MDKAETAGTTPRLATVRRHLGARARPRDAAYAVDCIFFLSRDPHQVFQRGEYGREHACVSGHAVLAIALPLHDPRIGLEARDEALGRWVVEGFVKVYEVPTRGRIPRPERREKSNVSPQAGPMVEYTAQILSRP